MITIKRWFEEVLSNNIKGRGVLIFERVTIIIKCFAYHLYGYGAGKETGEKNKYAVVYNNISVVNNK